MIFRDLIQGGFGILMFQKCQVRGYLSAVYGHSQGLGPSEGASECSGLVWCSKCSILEMLEKAKLHVPDTFETSKYQNLPV